MIALRRAVDARLPAVDLPEIILEIAARTGFAAAFTHISERASRAIDLDLSLCAVLLSEACNTGLEPLTRNDIPALRRDRLSWVNQNFVRDDSLSAANAPLVAAQNTIPLAQAWGGGEIASADGIRFVVPVKTVHAGPNPKYFGRERGVTYYNLISGQFTGLHGITVRGTLRDILSLLALVLDQHTELQRTRIMTDTGAYSDVGFGLFRLLGYRFSPRLAAKAGLAYQQSSYSPRYACFELPAPRGAPANRGGPGRTGPIVAPEPQRSLTTQPASGWRLLFGGPIWAGDREFRAPHPLMRRVFRVDRQFITGAGPVRTRPREDPRLRLNRGRIV